VVGAPYVGACVPIWCCVGFILKKWLTPLPSFPVLFLFPLDTRRRAGELFFNGVIFDGGFCWHSERGAFLRGHYQATTHRGAFFRVQCLLPCVHLTQGSFVPHVRAILGPGVSARCERVGHGQSIVGPVVVVVGPAAVGCCNQHRGHCHHPVAVARWEGQRCQNGSVIPKIPGLYDNDNDKGSHLP
jgi:hypothetical protein